MLGLENKVVVITGGTRGIGFETVRAFLEQRAKVILFGSRKETVDEALSKLANEGYVVKGYYPDLSNYDEVESTFAKIYQEEGKIDILINNAGISANKKIEETTALDFEKIMDMAQEGDFIFLDPPYDTEFSDYENRGFGEADQRRLAKRLHDTKAKFLLIIKNTPLISELYQNTGYRVFAFDNKYTYCVKGRNDRNAVHLIVTNYDLDKTV